MSGVDSSIFNISNVRLPTYLREFIEDSTDITLICSRKSSVTSEDDLSPVKNIKNDSSLSTLDLTGDPLKVELTGDVSFESMVGCERPNNWTSDEERHYPVTKRLARQILNKFNEVKVTEEGGHLPVYCICDGSDNENTVIIGVDRTDAFIKTILVNVVGYYSENLLYTTVDYMKAEHIKNVMTDDAQISYQTQSIYSIHGYNLSTYPHLDNVELSGSIWVEVTHDEPLYGIPQLQSNVKMVVQVITGHQLSPLYFLWQDISRLQLYLDIMQNSDKCNLERIIISKEGIDIVDISFNISNLLKTANLLERECQNTLDLKNIRRENVLDKLWGILKECQNLSDLRDAFHFLFEELADVGVVTQIPEDNKSTVATIVKGILSGKLAVPTVTFPQSLKFLFELGCEKLKSDYLAVLNDTYPVSQDAILEKWNQLSNKEGEAPDSKRKTRFSVNPKLMALDLKENVSKLSYLGQMHVAMDVIYLVKEHCQLPEESFDHFFESIFSKYLENNLKDFDDLKTNQLCEFSVLLNLENSKMFQDKKPVSWSMQMKSVLDLCEITTIFHMAEYPIFPKTIFNYDITVENTDKRDLYVSRMVTYKHFI